MTAVAERGLQPAGATPPPARRNRLRVPAWVSLPFAFSVVNGIAFLIVRPGVNDLWAARARADAVSNGVGLTYWFSWFGGGSTPGNYSVLTPYFSAWITAELVGALSAVAISLLAAGALRGTPHAAAANALAALATAINLWSGRVPFLLGCAFALVALIAVVKDKRAVIVVATLLTVLTSPVSAAFLALGVSGAFLAGRSHRIPSAVAMGTVVVGFGGVAIAFGTPGPQHFSMPQFLECIAGLVLLLFARAPKHLRIVLWLSLLTAILMALIPNGMGSNFARMVWFCLPVAVLAVSGRSTRVALLLTLPVVLSGANLTVSDLRQASQPVADTSYYEPLAHELDSISGMSNYRLEVVAETAHAAYDALLNHAMLARGWETQEDNHLNRSLRQAALDATTYKVWLDNNSVGYVALPRGKPQTYPEYALVSSGLLRYLTEVWSSTDWALYRVSDAQPIVAPPQKILDYSQSKMTIRVRCTKNPCSFPVRIRFSKYLRGTLVPGTGNPRANATFVDDGYGYTTMTTTGAGDYVLHGSVKKLFR